MKIATVSSKLNGRTDQLLSLVAARLQAEGLQLSGVTKVLENSDPDDHYCDMDLRILPNGPDIRITQDLGEGATSCRLDAAALAQAVALTEKNQPASADLFILNKFGPQEAEGRGFCNAIASALECDTPVLIGVGSCRDAFEDFVAGDFETLPEDEDAIYEWCKEAVLKS